MNLKDPIGDSSWSPLFVRITLGAFFLLAGLKKLDDPAGFVQEVQAMNVLPQRLAVLYGVLLPYVEVMAGGLLVAGWFTTFASILAALMLGSFVVAFGIFPTGTGIFNKDLILLAGAVSLLYSGAGACSVDQFNRAPAKG